MDARVETISEQRMLNRVAQPKKLSVGRSRDIEGIHDNTCSEDEVQSADLNELLS